MKCSHISQKKSRRKVRKSEHHFVYSNVFPHCLWLFYDRSILLISKLRITHTDTIKWHHVRLEAVSILLLFFTTMSIHSHFNILQNTRKLCDTHSFASQWRNPFNVAYWEMKSFCTRMAETPQSFHSMWWWAQSSNTSRTPVHSWFHDDGVRGVPSPKRLSLQGRWVRAVTTLGSVWRIYESEEVRGQQGVS